MFLVRLSILFKTCLIFVQVLQANTGSISSRSLCEEIEKLNVTVMHSNIRVGNPSGADSSTADGYAEDVETEINSYFHQMFSGQLAVDTMIQMLARYKESSEKRHVL